MNRERARELLPVIKALANGEEIEFKHISISGDWKNLSTALMVNEFPNNAYSYRIKPKPREWYANPMYLHAHAPNGECEQTGCIKVREVLD